MRCAQRPHGRGAPLQWEDYNYDMFIWTASMGIAPRGYVGVAAPALLLTHHFIPLTTEVRGGVRINYIFPQQLRCSWALHVWNQTFSRCHRSTQIHKVSVADCPPPYDGDIWVTSLTTPPTSQWMVEVQTWELAWAFSVHTLISKHI